MLETAKEQPKEEDGRYQERSKIQLRSKRFTGIVASYSRKSGRGCIFAPGRKDIVVDILDVKRQKALEPGDKVSFELKGVKGELRAKQVVVLQRSRSKSPAGSLASVSPRASSRRV